MKKYELTTYTKTLADGTVLHRIRALKDFSLVYGGHVYAGDLGGWVEKEDNLSQAGPAWIYCNALAYGNAEVGAAAVVYGDATICGDARVKETHDYAVFKSTWWHSGESFTYTRSNKMWKDGGFYGTGEELIAIMYKADKLLGRCYEAIVKAQEAIDKAVEDANAEKWSRLMAKFS